MFWPFKKKAKDPYDPVIAKQIDDQWGNFNQLVHEKVGHLEEEYVRWRKRSKIAVIAIVVGVILIAGDEGGSTVELLGHLFGFSGSGMLITFLLGLLLVDVSVWVLWRWSSVWRRGYGTPQQQKLLSSWPTDVPKNYLQLLNAPLTTGEEESLERSEEKSIPYGRDTWVQHVTKKYGIEQVLRGVGRPRNGG